MGEMTYEIAKAKVINLNAQFASIIALKGVLEKAEEAEKFLGGLDEQVADKHKRLKELEAEVEAAIGALCDLEEDAYSKQHTLEELDAAIEKQEVELGKRKKGVDAEVEAYRVTLFRKAEAEVAAEKQARLHEVDDRQSKLNALRSESWGLEQSIADKKVQHDSLVAAIGKLRESLKGL
jgi:chromosome segregation ATPase